MRSRNPETGSRSGAAGGTATNILFIVGGAFAGLDKVIEGRISTRSMGINADIKTKEEKLDIKENMLQKVEPDDLASATQSK